MAAHSPAGQTAQRINRGGVERNAGLGHDGRMGTILGFIDDAVVAILLLAITVGVAGVTMAKVYCGLPLWGRLDGSFTEDRRGC